LIEKCWLNLVHSILGVIQMHFLSDSFFVSATSLNNKKGKRNAFITLINCPTNNTTLVNKPLSPKKIAK